MTLQNPTPWQGRNDQEEAPFGRRWHHQVVMANTESHLMSSDSIGLLGFACDLGVKRNLGRQGAAEGPLALRDKLRNLAWNGGDRKLVDFGDVKVEGEDLEAGQARLAEEIGRAVPRISRLLVVGGGHETALGSFAGLRKALGPEASIGIINLDAHFDLRRPGPQGTSSGTPFFQAQSLAGAKNFHYYCLGISREANTEGLFRRAQEWGVKYCFDHEMTLADMPQLQEDLCAFAGTLDALYLTVDLDVLPHYQAPGVSAPAARGVDLAVIEKTIDLVIASAQQCRFGLPLVEISELNPMYDQQGVSARTAAMLACRMLGPI